MKRSETKRVYVCSTKRQFPGRVLVFAGTMTGMMGISLAAALCMFSGCKTAGPDYVAPLSPPPNTWNAELRAGETVTSAETPVHWWTVFNDPILTGLVARAQAGNLDVRQAVARVRAGRAEREMAMADRLPTLAANASASITRSRGQTGPARTSEHYANSLNASWELDLFGRKRHAAEAAEATWQASQEDLHDVLVSLCAEVALAYVDVRAYQLRLAIADSNLVSQMETYEITRWRLQAQLVTQLDVDQARLILEQTRASLPSLRTGLEKSKHRLATLLGLPPGAMLTLLRERRAIPVTPPEVAVGVPAEVLRHRPDVRRAERQFAAQTAKIGIAAADRYPNFTLSGSIGLEALVAGDLYTLAARTLSGATAAGWTLLDGGRIDQTVTEQEALRDESYGAYEAAILAALQDVEDALVAYADEQDRRRALADAEQAARSAAAVARDRYASGLIDFQTVLSTQQSLLSVQDSLASSEAQATSNLVRLYKALGGGWTPLPSVNSDLNEKK
ncbi:MAG: efflux transporter outer membrane subunit [Kiritimatiellia bacterium]